MDHPAPVARRFSIHTVAAHQGGPSALRVVNRTTEVRVGADGEARFTVRTPDGAFVCEGHGNVRELPAWLLPVVSSIYGFELVPAALAGD